MARRVNVNWRQNISKQLQPQLEALVKQIDQVIGKDFPAEVLNQKVLKKLLQPIKPDLQREAPRGDPKHKPDAKPLHKTIAIRAETYRTRSFGWIGPSYPSGAHGHLVEFGTKPHPVNHPGATPKPWLEPAVLKYRSKLQRDMQKELVAIVQELREKAAVRPGGV